MSESLKAILILMSIYGVIGLLPLYWASIAKTKWERLFVGVFLIYYASFMLTSFALVTGAVDKLPAEETSQLVKLSEFNQYVLIMGFIFTFLFGGVGTNIVTSVISADDNTEILRSLHRIESKVDRISRQPSKKSYMHKTVITLNVLVFALTIFIMFSWMS
ncbi:hypothetical protein [Photobacterium sanguinicancri]|uniref:hypothetical protein n=1 Tax=Photobacterium sanguinicancri TaxID=875932 RepID=UPI003D1507CB